MFPDFGYDRSFTEQTMIRDCTIKLLSHILALANFCVKASATQEAYVKVRLFPLLGFALNFI